MIEKFAIKSGCVPGEFLDLNHTSKSMFLVSLMIPKFAPDTAASSGELRNRDTRVPAGPPIKRSGDKRRNKKAIGAAARTPKRMDDTWTGR
jgi:hypothetical protein